MGTLLLHTKWTIKAVYSVRYTLITMKFKMVNVSASAFFVTLISLLTKLYLHWCLTHIMVSLTWSSKAHSFKTYSYASVLLKPEVTSWCCLLKSCPIWESFVLCLMRKRLFNWTTLDFASVKISKKTLKWK